MTQQEFLDKLRAGVASLPPGRIVEIEEDILRHFDEGRASGAAEQDLAAMLGDPDALAREYVSLYEDSEGTAPPQGRANEGGPIHPEDGVEGAAPGPLPLRILTTIGLGLFNLAIALPLILALVAVWFALVLASLGLVLAGVLGLITVVVNFFLSQPLPYVLDLNGVYYPALSLFASIAAGSLGGLMAMGVLPAGRQGLRLLRRYTRWTLGKLSGVPA